MSEVSAPPWNEKWVPFRRNFFFNEEDKLSSERLQNIWTSVIKQTSFSHYKTIWLAKILKLVKNINIWQSAKGITHTEENSERSKCVRFQDSKF